MLDRFLDSPGGRLTAAIVILGILAVGLSLWATVWGAGVSPDSVHYVTGARSLNAGLGLTYPDGDGSRQPITLWPPLFPLLLSIPHVVGLDPALSGRILNALLLAANIGLVALIAFRATRGSDLAGVTAALLFMSSPDIVELHLWIWSEPLFLFLTLMGLFLTISFPLYGRRGSLWFAGAAAGLALATRFAGAASVATIILMALIWRQLGSRWTRLRAAAGYGLLGLAPLGIWLAWNKAAWGSTLDREIGFHRLYSVHFLPALDTVRGWLLPGMKAAPVGGLAVLVCAVVILGILVRFAALHAFGQGHAERGEVPWEMLAVLGTYLILYGLVTLTAKIFVDPNFPFNQRIMAPALMTTILLMVTIGYAVLQSPFPARSSRAWIRPAVLFLVTAAVAMQVVAAGGEALRMSSRAHERGLGYQSKSWRQSALVQAVEAIPVDTKLFSNADDGILFATGRPVWRLPEAGNGINSPAQAPAWASEMEAQMEGESAYVVYFKAITWRKLVTIDDLATWFNVKEVLRTEEGVLVSVRPPG